MHEVVYVYMLGEGTDVWRPVPSEDLGGSRYRLGDVAERARDEVWEFAPGAIVVAEQRRLSGGLCMVAIALAP